MNNNNSEKGPTEQNNFEHEQIKRGQFRKGTFRNQPIPHKIHGKKDKSEKEQSGK